MPWRHAHRDQHAHRRTVLAGGLLLVLALGALPALLLPASPTPGSPNQASPNQASPTPGSRIPASTVRSDAQPGARAASARAASARAARLARPARPAPASHAAPPAGSAHPAAPLVTPLLPALAARPAGPRTSCRSVAHIGDSTSVGLVSPASLPRRAQRLPARYAAVGVRHLRLDASGGRSIVEKLPGQVNGYQVARAWRDHGYRGCWVIALGTNDTANVAVGSVAGRGARIAAMMSLAHGEPVLWVGTRTVRTSGPWSEANMRLWNHDLLRACARYPNLRVFGWSSVARRSWYLPDGIHYTRPGYAARARDIATALTRAFAASGPSRGCVVR